MITRSFLTILWAGFGPVLFGCGSPPPEAVADSGQCAGCGVSCPSDCAGGDQHGIGGDVWSGPLLLWAGPDGEAPPCPSVAPDLVYEGQGGLDVTQHCPACACGAPTCLLPEGAIISNIPACPGNDGPDATLFPFLMPEGWTGECTSSTIIPAEHMSSIIFLPTRVTPCEAHVGVEPPVTEARWTQAARACPEIVPSTEGPAAPGFIRCVMRQGQGGACPSRFPEQRVFYRGVESSLGCTPCTCGPPEGSVCLILLEYSYGTPCSDWNGGGAVGLNGSCVVHLNGPAPDPLASLTATPLDSYAGTCAPHGGEPEGEAIPTDPTTFCCEAPLPP